MFARLLRRLGSQRWFAAIGARVATPVDRFVHRRTGRMVTPRGLSPVMLHLPDRRPVPLLSVERDGGWIVAGTNWGREHHPRWSARLENGEQADLESRGTVTRVRARLLSGLEREEAWLALTGLWPGYDAYESRSGRTARVFLLTPIEG